ncbi:MAG: hypothetical protein H6981_02940 [Gammaproteobacteria bacterium]|nr:hypothetical protein [Gammaproteobacteria bacterium]MCP5135745.1 hypothetical protein [Gammaproteobacteria bacterium]
MSALDPDDTWPTSARAHIASSDLVAPPPLKKRRLASGWVASKTHTSGYDEILPTDTQTKLLSDMAGSSSSIPGGTLPSLGGKFTGYKRKRADDLYSAAEGVRTDTANTLLALPGGDVAFHSHAGGPTTGQAEGHHLRRRAFARALAQKWSAKADSVFAGAVLLASRPPGAQARSAVDTTKLRDQSALTPWEKNRETAKSMVNQGFAALPPVERTALRKTIQLSFDELNKGAPPGFHRELAPAVPTSPRRSTAPDPAKPFAAAGGDYLLPKAAVAPAAPVSGETPGAFGRRVSQPFRVKR